MKTKRFFQNIPLELHANQTSFGQWCPACHGSKHCMAWMKCSYYSTECHLPSTKFGLSAV